MILSALSPLLYNSTWPQHTLHVFAEHWPTVNHTMRNYLIRDCWNHKGCCTLFRQKSTIAAGISSSSFVQVSTRQLAVSSLSKGISSTLSFYESIGTDRTQTRNLSERCVGWANLTTYKYWLRLPLYQNSFSHQNSITYGWVLRDWLELWSFAWRSVM